MFGGIPFAHFAGGMPGGMPGGHPGRRAASAEADTTSLYAALGVSKESSQSEIKKAYMKLARKEHPDKGGDPDKFKAIQHAYDILGDEEKRELYDAGGEEAVEHGHAGGPGDIFDMFFGGGRARSGPAKGKPTVHPLRVSLEDLYAGKTVKLAVTRNVFAKDASGSIMDQAGNRYSKTQERKPIELNIERGMRDGQKIVIEDGGDIIPGQLPGDLVFVVKAKEHPVYQRKGADLVMKKTVTLYEALAGTRFVVPMLDGREVLISTAPGQVLKPEGIMEVPDCGMPVAGNVFMKGVLIVQFEVEFPETLALSDAQKRVLAGILPQPEPLPALGEDMEEGTLRPMDMRARQQREQLGESAVDSDDEGHPGMQQVQCAQQ